MELNEQELLDLIAGGTKLVVKVWMDNCPFCTEYAPIVEAVSKQLQDIKFVSFKLAANTGGSSQFKREYMKVGAGEKLSAPATFVFENGAMKYRHFGKMTSNDLINFITVGVEPVNPKIEQAQKEYMNVLARRGEITFLMDELPKIDKKIVELRTTLGMG